MRTAFKPLISILSIGFTLLATIGCGAIATERPIYDASKDTVTDPRFTGHWYSAPGKWSIDVVRWRCGYWMRGIYPASDANGSQEPLPVDMVRFHRKAFLFMANPPFQRFTGTPLLFCYRVEFCDRGQTMRLRLLNTVALSEYLEDHPGILKYRVIDDGPFYHSLPATRPTTDPAATQPTTQRLIKNMTLTDDPRRIRDVLAAHADDGRLWTEPIVFGRVAGDH